MSPKINSKYQIKSPKSKIIQIKVAIVTQGQVLGFEDIINSKYHSTSVKCTTKTGSLLAINAKEFLYIMQKDKTEWHKIEQYFKFKAVTVRKAIKTSFYNIAEYKA